ncbi:aldo/keto reductase [Agarivorans sp. MS3-6]
MSKIAPIADSMDLSVSELAIAYAYSNDDLFCTIPGVSKTEHVKSIYKILNLNHTAMQAIKNIDLGDELCFPKFL